MSDNVPDMTSIFKKLENAGLIKKEDNVFYGLFSIKNDSHLLTAEELELLLHVLHAGSHHDDQECSDLHQFKLDMAH